MTLLRRLILTVRARAYERAIRYYEQAARDADYALSSALIQLPDEKIKAINQALGFRAKLIAVRETLQGE